MWHSSFALISASNSVETQLEKLLRNMGNAVGSAASHVKSKWQNSSPRDGDKLNIDEIDLHELDETKSHLKEDKSTRKTKEYKQLRTLARQGIDDQRRFQVI